MSGRGAAALPPYDAIVLAGGAALRMGGTDKVTLAVGGSTLLDVVLRACAAAVTRIVVGPPRPLPPGVRLTREQPPGAGPVAAVAAGLPLVGAAAVAVLAGDLPGLDAAAITTLRRALATRPDTDISLATDPSGRDQLLIAVWRTAALRAAVAALAGGPVGTPVRALVAGAAVVRTPLPTRVCADCDTPADLANARADLVRQAGRETRQAGGETRQAGGETPDR